MVFQELMHAQYFVSPHKNQHVRRSEIRAVVVVEMHVRIFKFI